MIPIDTVIQNTLQVLRDPAWQGAGVIVSSALSIFAIYYSHQAHTHRIPASPLLKKVDVQIWNATAG